MSNLNYIKAWIKKFTYEENDERTDAFVTISLSGSLGSEKHPEVDDRLSSLSIQGYRKLVSELVDSFGMTEHTIENIDVRMVCAETGLEATVEASVHLAE